jgi:hypothetical protein
MDDTDVIHLDMSRDKEVLEAHHGLQESVILRGWLLIATGGSLKPAKCYYHLSSFSWKPNGTWVYNANKEKDNLQIEIPLPNGSFAPIEHCGVTVAYWTLGVMACPAGDHTASIDLMKEKAQGWINQATSGKLSRCNLWFLAGLQLRPSVGFGIGLNSAPYLVLAECFMKQYCKLVPLGGERRSAN